MTDREPSGRATGSGAGLSLVAWYGDKPPALVQLLTGLQRLVTARLGNRAALRPVPDIHATLLGLRAPLPAGAGPSPDGIAGYLDEVHGWLSARRITVRIGGYHADGREGLLSRGQPLRARSFGVVGRQAVVIGWPWAGVGATAALDELRRAAGRHGLRHKYHRGRTDVDPDAYLVIADLVGDLPAGEAGALAAAGRDLLDTTTAALALDPGAVCVVRYADPRLPAASTAAVSLAAARADPATWWP